MESKNIATLSQYIPREAAKIIAAWIEKHECFFKISKGRTTKFGDYRPPFQNKGHRISVNHNLNPYAFLITTVHEFAHLITWEQYQSKVKPHGTEWKLNFKELMQPFFMQKIFPKDIHDAVAHYLINPAASSCTDQVLFKILKRYDHPREGVVMVDQLPVNQLFVLGDSRIFKKLNKVRTRYRCMEIKTGKMFLFHPLAEVKLMEG